MALWPRRPISTVFGTGLVLLYCQFNYRTPQALPRVNLMDALTGRVTGRQGSGRRHRL